MGSAHRRPVQHRVPSRTAVPAAVRSRLPRLYAKTPALRPPDRWSAPSAVLVSAKRDAGDGLIVEPPCWSAVRTVNFRTNTAPFTANKSIFSRYLHRKGSLYARYLISGRHAHRQPRRLLPRAREVMSEVDFIAAEDTRVTKNSQTAPRSAPGNRWSATTSTTAASAVRKSSPACLRAKTVHWSPTPVRLRSPTPARIWSPCAPPRRACHPIPGCCAAVCVLAASSLPTGRWCFEGFLLVNKKPAGEHLDALKDEKRSISSMKHPQTACNAG